MMQAKNSRITEVMQVKKKNTEEITKTYRTNYSLTIEGFFIKKKINTHIADNNFDIST